LRRLQPLSIAALAALGAFALLAATPPPHLERALAAQRELAAERPDDAGVANDLANLLALAGETNAAEEAYQRAIELAPSDPAPRFNYGLLLRESGREMAAMRQFRATVDLEPRHAWAHYQVGEIYQGWGLDRLARKAYVRAFRLDPRLADARSNPAVLDNRAATAAMLMAWKEGGGAPVAVPRGYSEPARIAGLLLETTKEKPAAAETSAEPAADEGEGGGGFARLAGGGSASEAAGGERAPGGLEPEAGEQESDEDYEDPSGDSHAPRVLTGADLRPSGTVNQVAPADGRGTSGRQAGGASGRTRIAPNRPRYVPGPGSTGRLDLHLAPPAAEPAPLAG
jgi:tetratricopeptide (TPR) repeat protein